MEKSLKSIQISFLLWLLFFRDRSFHRTWQPGHGGDTSGYGIFRTAEPESHPGGATRRYMEIQQQCSQCKHKIYSVYIYIYYTYMNHILNNRSNCCTISFGLASPWPCWGVCKTLVTDRGRPCTDTPVLHESPQSLWTQKSSLPIGNDPN